MSPHNAKSTGRKKPKVAPLPIEVPANRELVLHGDISDLTDVFVSRQRRNVTCPVPESTHQRIQNHPGGTGQFIEDAVASFEGDLNLLVRAAAYFVDRRRMKASTDPPRNLSARVMPETFDKIRLIEDALKSIRGMSRAKVVAGLVQLYLSSSTR